MSVGENVASASAYTPNFSPYRIHCDVLLELFIIFFKKHCAVDAPLLPLAFHSTATLNTP
jgi:hypothetical protein